MHPDFMAMMIRERQRELEQSMRCARRASRRSVKLLQMAYNARAKFWSRPQTAVGAKAEPGLAQRLGDHEFSGGSALPGLDGGVFLDSGGG